VNVSVTVLDGGVGLEASKESGTRTRSAVPDAATTAVAGCCTPFIATVVVEIKFVPVKKTSWNTAPRAPILGLTEVIVGSASTTMVTDALALTAVS
jgi:hypothetical protein